MENERNELTMNDEIEVNTYEPTEIEADEAPMNNENSMGNGTKLAIGGLVIAVGALAAAKVTDLIKKAGLAIKEKRKARAKKLLESEGYTVDEVIEPEFSDEFYAEVENIHEVEED